MKLNYLLIRSKKLIWTLSHIKEIPGSVDGIIYPHCSGFIITDNLCLPRLFLFKENGSRYAIFTSVEKHNNKIRLLFSTTQNDSQYFDLERLCYDEWINLASNLYRHCCQLTDKKTDYSFE
jgi:hypothetical protein